MRASKTNFPLRHTEKTKTARRFFLEDEKKRLGNLLREKTDRHLMFGAAPLARASFSIFQEAVECAKKSPLPERVSKTASKHLTRREALVYYYVVTFFSSPFQIGKLLKIVVVHSLFRRFASREIIQLCSLKWRIDFLT